MSLHPPCGGYPLHSIHSSSPHKSCAFAGPPGQSTGHWYWENGGFRLYTLFGDQPRSLRPAVGEQGQAVGPNHPPPTGASLKAGFPARLVLCLSTGRGFPDAPGPLRPIKRELHHPMLPQPRGRTTAALCPESGTSRRLPDRSTFFSLFHYGTAVTAGRGPHHRAERSKPPFDF